MHMRRAAKEAASIRIVVCVLAFDVRAPSRREQAAYASISAIMRTVKKWDSPGSGSPPKQKLENNKLPINITGEFAGYQ